MTIQMEKLESLLAKEHINALDVIGALDYCLNAKAVEFEILNNSRKAWGKPIRSTPTRLAQKGTLYSKDGEVVQASPSSTKGATSTFKSARKDNGKEYAAILLDSLLPNESSKLAAMLAIVDDVDFTKVLGKEAGQAAEKLAKATVELFFCQVEVNNERLPSKVSRKSQAMGDSDAQAEADESSLTPAQRAANRIARLKGNELPYSESEQADEQADEQAGEQADFNADELDELTDVKYIGTSTAEKLLSHGWTLDQINVQYKLHGELPPEVQEIVSAKAADNLKKEIE
jgi:predicted flap endonuclease-1-like 5' DNA nuclease